MHCFRNTTKNSSRASISLFCKKSSTHSFRYSSKYYSEFYQKDFLRNSSRLCWIFYTENSPERFLGKVQKGWITRKNRFLLKLAEAASMKSSIISFIDSYKKSLRDLFSRFLLNHRHFSKIFSRYWFTFFRNFEEK